ncbi:hypothetical protein NM688_g6570 [Phlebia brevispora]|uniref:Uncharacterized protein n=1 Tax=Phlebia brevispora TaxID=194682 RepID=A0ACC1SEH9_9APHY|nr:hypothetical protein NM688_g6570 [Phlebia brevispora]
MSDPRFARLKSDPRFRRVKKKESKVVVDERFKDVFHHKTDKKDKRGKGRVDKYGRPLSDTHEQDSLRRFYRFQDEDEDAKDAETSTKVPDYARGEVLMESSDEEDNEQASGDDESDSDGVVTLGAAVSKPIHVLDDNEEPEVDLDEDNFVDLDAQAAEYSKAHEPDDDAPEAAHTRRLAVVNLDWDHVRATHLYKIFSSLVSPTASALPLTSISSVKAGKKSATRGNTSRVVRGKVLNVRVYPSAFGRERLAREEKEGPPSEVFTKADSKEEEDEEGLTLQQTADGEDYNEQALRKYQLERLRYYYAIVECDSAQTASHLYSELEGTELERSANVFDLSFVPDNMTFDDQFRDEATEDISGPYKPLDFATDALRHSKVKLTWDEDDPERNRITRRTLSRKEIEENDFAAYLASGTESESEEEGRKTKVDRDKLRALLLSGDDDALPEGWSKGLDDDADNVDMEITFTPGLSISKDTNGDETTLEKYQRKMKEKKKRRMEEQKEKATEAKVKAQPTPKDDFFDDGSGDESEEHEELSEGKKKNGKSRTERQDSPKPERHEATAEELALLAASDNPKGEPKHFDMKAVVKAEKMKGKKPKHRKAKKNDEDANELQEDFSIDVKDERFRAVLDDHSFAIDPSNPHFKKTKSMSAILEERSKRRTEAYTKGEASTSSRVTASNSRTNLKSLVERVKRKSVAADGKGVGKRRKL